jgi:hypothetical protein
VAWTDFVGTGLYPAVTVFVPKELLSLGTIYAHAP